KPQRTAHSAISAYRSSTHLPVGPPSPSMCSRRGEDRMFRRILIALDERTMAVRALDMGSNLGQAQRAEVALVHVVNPQLVAIPESGMPTVVLLAELKRAGHALLIAAAARLGGTPPPWQFLREGKPSREILATAHEWSADLIILGTHSRSGLARIVFGSTA